jgi:hypothetical protein
VPAQTLDDLQPDSPSLRLLSRLHQRPQLIGHDAQPLVGALNPRRLQHLDPASELSLAEAARKTRRDDFNGRIGLVHPGG